MSKNSRKKHLEKYTLTSIHPKANHEKSQKNQIYLCPLDRLSLPRRCVIKSHWSIFSKTRVMYSLLLTWNSCICFLYRAITSTILGAKNPFILNWTQILLVFGLGWILSIMALLKVKLLASLSLTTRLPRASIDFSRALIFFCEAFKGSFWAILYLF